MTLSLMAMSGCILMRKLPRVIDGQAEQDTYLPKRIKTPRSAEGHKNE